MGRGGGRGKERRFHSSPRLFLDDCATVGHVNVPAFDLLKRRDGGRQMWLIRVESTYTTPCTLLEDSRHVFRHAVMWSGSLSTLFASRTWQHR
jgi:hypothetical protein